MSVNQRFQLASITEKFNVELEKLQQFLSQEATDEMKSVYLNLRDELNEDLSKGFFTVAFIGQYSAGKSTIISALTGRNDIYIDSNVSTSNTQSYDWNHIEIIDTPGLWAGCEDHDIITYEAIEKADLLVFCLTHSLFDSVTLLDFKKLAYEKQYAKKIMILVNKLSKESGDDNEKIASYYNSLEKALAPHRFDDFPLCFIDAKDYKDGLSQNDDFLIEISRFQDFITELNKFVKNRAEVARFDLPVRTTLKWINQAKKTFVRNSPEDRAFIEVLVRLDRIVEQNREDLRIRIDSISLKGTREMAKEGEILAESVGGEDFEETRNNTIVQVQNLCQKVELELTKNFIEVTEKLKKDIQNLHCGDLVQELLRLDRVNADGSIGRPFHHGNLLNNFLNGLENLPEAFFMGSMLALLVEQSSINKGTWEHLNSASQGLQEAWRSILQHPTGDGYIIAMNSLHEAQQKFKEANPFPFLKENVEGSGLHHLIQNFGHLGDNLGIHFDTFNSVEVTQILGDIAHFAGPILGMLGFYADAERRKKESQLERDMAKIREDIRKKFQRMSDDLESNIKQRSNMFEADVCNEIEKYVANLRKQHENDMSTSNQFLRRLIEINQEFEKIRHLIDSLFFNEQEQVSME